MFSRFHENHHWTILFSIWTLEKGSDKLSNCKLIIWLFLFLFILIWCISAHLIKAVCSSAQNVLKLLYFLSIFFIWIWYLPISLGLTVALPNLASGRKQCLVADAWSLRKLKWIASRNFSRLNCIRNFFQIKLQPGIFEDWIALEIMKIILCSIFMKIYCIQELFEIEMH